MSNVLLTLLVLLVLIVLGVLVVVSLQLRRSGAGEQAVISERLSQLGPVTRTVNDIRVDLASLQADLRVRQEEDRRTAESVRRLETIIAGTYTKGVAGENILETVFARLPPDWQIRDFKVGAKIVEFGLRLPNNLVLPIDSKWTATSEVERFAASDDVGEQRRLKQQIERAVMDKAREVKKYIDPNITASFGLAVVPDAAYEVCGGLHAEIFKLNVVVVSHSMFVPYLLLIFQTTLKTSRSVDLQKLDAYLSSVEEGIAALQGELEGRFSKAITMLGNSRADMAGQLSKINAGLTNLRLNTATKSPPELDEPARTEFRYAPGPDGER